MARSNKEHRVKFAIDFEGQTYPCERILTGKRTLYQTIEVVGIGSTSDSHPYNAHDPLDRMRMESVAKIIAGEIILKASRSSR